LRNKPFEEEVFGSDVCRQRWSAVSGYHVPHLILGSASNFVISDFGPIFFVFCLAIHAFVAESLCRASATMILSLLFEECSDVRWAETNKRPQGDDWV
jgi:hypothetical protein